MTDRRPRSYAQEVSPSLLVLRVVLVGRVSFTDISQTLRHTRPPTTNGHRLSCHVLVVYPLITMAVKAMVPVLVAMMLLTGVCNTLLTKYQDMQCVAKCDSKKPKTFEQPVSPVSSGAFHRARLTIYTRYFKHFRCSLERLPAG